MAEEYYISILKQLPRILFLCNFCT